MGQPPPFAQAVQPTREGLERKELKQKKRCSNSHRILHILVIKTTCLLTEILWELVFHSCLLSLVKFLLVPFQIQAFFPLGAECCLGFQQFSTSGKNGPPGKSGSGSHCLVQIREAFALESRKTRLFLGHCDSFWDIVWFLFIFSFDLKLPLLLKVTSFKFQAPSMWICLARFTHSQLTDVQITNKQIILCDAGTPDSCNYYSEMTFGK